MRADRSVPALVAAVFVTFLVVYGCTMAPGLLLHDSAEFQTVGVLGGVPHSTGYPTFVLVARPFAWLLPGDLAWRINGVSVAFGAAAVAAVLAALLAFGIPAAPAAITAAMFGLTFTYWRAAERAEVYTLAMFFGALALGACLAYARDRRRRHALLAGVLMGLTACSHLSYGPAIAVGGLALAWQLARHERRPVPALALLLLAFLAGLAPYGYIVYQDTHHATVDFLDHVANLRSTLHLSQPPFESPWDRLRWLVFGGNYMPPRALQVSIRDVAHSLADLAFVVAGFELGPLAVALGRWGFVREWRTHRTRTLLFAIAIAAVALLAAQAAVAESLLHLLALPALLLALPFVARGVQAARERFGSRPAALAVAAWGAFFALLVLPPHAIRAYAIAHPIGPRHYHVEEEPSTPACGFVPTLAGVREPEVFARSALAALPESALVLGTWREYTALRFVHLVEHVRPDLRIEFATTEATRPTVDQWRADPVHGRHAIAFVGKALAWTTLANEVDSLEVATGAVLYVLPPGSFRRPLASAAP